MRDDVASRYPIYVCQISQEIAVISVNYLRDMHRNTERRFRCVERAPPNWLGRGGAGGSFPLAVFTSPVFSASSSRPQGILLLQVENPKRCNPSRATMKAVVLLLLLGLLAGATAARVAEEDNEFAEFEEFDEEEPPPAPQRSDAPQPAAADDEEEARVEEEEEFDHFQDEEEFEGLDQERQPSRPQGDKPHLTIAKVPLHLRSNWESFYLELLMLAGLAVYFGNFVAGRNKNHRLATAWFQSHRQLLLDNFALVGDDGRKELSPDEAEAGGPRQGL
ncbi:hypothetical protein MTO96_014356 [Rhipicephalus appendiculatus]